MNVVAIEVNLSTMLSSIFSTKTLPMIVYFCIKYCKITVAWETISHLKSYIKLSLLLAYYLASIVDENIVFLKLRENISLNVCCACNKNVTLAGINHFHINLKYIF